MSSRSIQYVFELIDRFSPIASKLSDVARKAEQSIMGMGKAAQQAEASVGRGAASAIERMRQRALEADPALQRATQRLREFGAAGEAAANRVRNLTQAHREIVKLEKEAALRNRYAGGGTRSSSSRSEAVHGVANAYFGAHLITSAAQYVSGFLDHANKVIVNEQKLKLNSFSDDQLKRARAEAGRLTGKYANVSRGDVMEMMYEGISIHGDAEDAIAKVELQARLASFLQSFEGGKHSGHTSAYNREVFAAIKSMEMKGVLEEMDPTRRKAEIEKYLGSMMAMKAVYGDQAKLTEYLTAQKRAGTAFYQFSDQFRFSALPAMVQEISGPVIGQQLMTAYQTIVGGTKLNQQTQIPMMKKYGLYDAKTGRFVQSFQDLYRNDPMTAAADILQRAGKAYGLDMSTESGQAEAKAKAMLDIVKLFPNRNASMLFSNIFQSTNNLRKHIDQMKRAQQEIADIRSGKAVFNTTTKAGAEASASRQFYNILDALGGPMVPAYVARMNNLAQALNSVGNSINTVVGRNPAAASAFGHAAVVGMGALAALTTLAMAGFAYAGIRTGLGFLMGSGAGAVAARTATSAVAGPLAGAAVGATMATMATRATMAARAMGTARVAAVGVGAAGIVAALGMRSFHSAVNGLGGAAGFVARVLRTAFYGTMLSYAIPAVWHFRKDLAAVGDYVMTFGQNLYNVLDTAFNKRFGSRERKAATKKLFEDLGFTGEMPDIKSWVSGLVERTKAELENSGWASYIRFFFSGDQQRMPYGERSELHKASALMGGRGVPRSYANADDIITNTTDLATKYGMGLDSKIGQELITSANNAARAARAAGIVDDMGLYTGNGQEGLVTSTRYYDDMFDRHARFVPGGIPTADRFGFGGEGFQAYVNGIPAGDAQREIAIRSVIDVSAPSVPIQVQVTGTINGAVTGSGQGTVTVAPRGESAPVDSTAVGAP
jgi:cell fate (sporulation/competence/biofilm development) regulator YlbF (YheA/YmcA/DUF963 family)